MARSLIMELWEKIIAAYPEIKATDDFKELGINLKDDSDGKGAYIAEWNYSKPIPSGLKLGK
jgi:hypothetical protein